MADKGVVSVSDFLNLSTKLEKVTIRSGAVMGRGMPRPDIVPETGPKRYERPGGLDYVKQFAAEEEKQLLMGHNSDPLCDMAGLPDSERYEVCQMEELTSIGSVPNLGDVDTEDSVQVYDRYDFRLRKTDLPIAKKRESIIRMVETNQVLIILGSTGCGKSTQVPQYILDHHAKMRKKCNIIVTQPRRIAATSVAKRVCHERDWELSTIVGYQIGLDNKTSADTRLTYCTTGVLREKLVRERSMLEYTHVILDEVHERDLETDFLMLIVRKLLRTNSRTVKVILMSATIDPSRFASYFSLRLGSDLCPAPVLEVEKLSPYKVQDFYIDQLRELGDIPTFDLDDEPRISDAAFDIAVRLIMFLDTMDLKGFQNDNNRTPTDQDYYKHAVLVFLPGIHEIEAMHERLEEKSKEDKKFRWHKIALHSSITKEEQATVFMEPAPGYRKVILSTNIAESSITVKDVVYVIDFCLTKHLVCDPETNFTSLRYAWASHSNCKQRAGRAGRVRHGRVYRMVPRAFYENVLPQDCDPEMVRCPLAQTVLKAKMLKFGEPRAIFSQAMDPPDLSRLTSTILHLKEAGALLMTSERKYSDYDGDITFLGTVMSNLPLDILLSKLIMFGHIFSILDDAIVIAAWMSVRNVFCNDFYERLGPYGARIGFTNGSNSDCITYLNLYHMFSEKVRTNYFKTSKDTESAFCKRNFLNLKAMKEANELVDELRKRLKNLGVYEHAVEGQPKWKDEELQLVRKVVIAGAFYPNYFTRRQADEEDAYKMLSNKDPFSSVYLQGLPTDQPGELYAKIFKDCLERYAGRVSNISFDGSSKVYIEFERNQNSSRNTNLPGKILYPVYRAIKMRQLKIPIRVPLLSAEKAKKRVEELGIETNRFLYLGKGCSEPASRLSALTDHCNFFVTHPKDPNNFWIVEEGVYHELKQISELLNTPDNTCPCSHRLNLNEIYAAPYPINSNVLYRARVNKENGNRTAEVIFIDYGNVVEKMPISLIRSMASEISDLKSAVATPPLAIECTLMGIGPSPISNRNETWSVEAKDRFIQFMTSGILTGEVFSIVGEVVSLDKVSDPSGRRISDILVEEGFAIMTEESYPSKLDHAQRQGSTLYSNPSSHKNSNLASTKQSYDKPVVSKSAPNSFLYPEPPTTQESSKVVYMRGPSSPLEMTVRSCKHGSQGKSVSIDLESVNSVLLDSHIEDIHDRLLVAGFVGTNSLGTKLKLGHTTYLPNLHGLFALLCLIFSPTIELRQSSDKSKFIGALCGLGFNKQTGISYYAENEMEIQFDVEITLNDLLLVNNLRFWINKPLATQEGQDMWDVTQYEMIVCQQKVKKYFLELLHTKRASQEKESFKHQYHWLQYDKGDLLDPGLEDKRAVYPPHFGLKITEKS